MPDKDLEDGPVIGDENFVNVDPDFANYSNEVDKPLPMAEVEDYNVDPQFREVKEDDEDEDSEPKKAEPATPAVPASPAVAPKSTTPATTTAAPSAKK